MKVKHLDHLNLTVPTSPRPRTGTGGSSASRSTAWCVHDPTGYEIEVTPRDDDTVRF